MPTITGTTSNAKTTGSQTSLTFAHTATGDDLYVAVGYFSGQGAAVTYGGVALQLLGRVVSAQSIEWWYLPAAPVGTASLVITPAASSWIASVARNVSGVDRDGVFRNLTSAAATSVAPSVAVTSAVGDLVLDCVICDVTNEVFTGGGSQTVDAAQNSLANTDTKAAASHANGAASVTMSWTLSVSDNWFISGLSLPADGTIPAPVTRLSQLPVEILRGSQPTPVLRLSQLPVEILRSPGTAEVINAVRLSQLPIEVLGLAPVGARLSQLPVEVLRLLPPPSSRLSQLPVEVLLLPPHDPLQVTQLAVETLDLKAPAPARVTQVAAEFLTSSLVHDAHVTLLCCELIIIPGDGECPSASDFPIDPATGTGCALALPTDYA